MLTMGEKQEYKYTEEFGYIPNDWNVFKLGNLATIGDIDHKMPKSVATGIPYVMTGDFIGDNELDFENAKKISETDYDNLSKKIKPELGDIIFARYASIGLIRLIKTKKKFLVSYSCAIIKPKATINSLYLFNFLKSDIFKNSITQEINANTQKNIGIDTLKLSNIYLPSIKEQEKIAGVLSDMDELIDKTQKLIDKKRNLKTATMQKLLKPQPHWVSKKLGDCSKICTGNENNENKISDGLYPFFVRSENIERINTYVFDGEAILVPGEGGIGKIFHYINGKFNYHQRIYKISNFNSIYGKYTYYYMKKFFGEYALSNSVKATVDSLRLPTFENFIINCPSVKKQRQIARVLSDMDLEIEKLEQELNKYKNLKIGMMQQLLTGKIRLLGPVNNGKQTNNVVEINSKQKHQANEEFKDAIIISMLTHKFASEKYPLGAFRRQKLSYLFKRYNAIPVDSYLKKAMGPYKPQIKYKGGEGIALRNKYVKSVNNRGLLPSDKIQSAVNYYKKYYSEESIDWLEKQFRYETNDNLETLATVDYAIVELSKDCIPISLDSIKKYIASDKEWLPKLSKPHFSDENILAVMQKSKQLFNSF